MITKSKSHDCEDLVRKTNLKNYKVFDFAHADKIRMIHNIVIPRNEESPQVTRQRLAILGMEFLAEIPRSSE
jgi:hypothetical protein